MKKLIVLFLIAVLPCLSGFSSIKDEIVGTWEADDKTKVEFLKDGTVHFMDNEGILNGKWSLLDDGRVKIESNGNAEILEVTFDGDVMKTVDVNKRVDTLKRVK